MDSTRINKLREQLQGYNVSGIYITNITNVRYLTGFTGSAGSILVLDKEAYFFTDGRYTEQVKDQVKNSKVYITGSSHIKEIQNQKLLPKDSRIGFEAEHISYSGFQLLKNNFLEVNWVETQNLIELIAAVKDMDEIDSLKMAVEITDKVFDEIIPIIKEGITENKIAATMSYKFKEHGAEGDSYDPIVASGWRSALPHATPTNKTLEKGDFVVMDFGALYNGYHADMTRTIVIGQATNKHKEIYQIVLESQLAGIKKAKAGITGAEVDQACRDIIKNAGYGKFFNHSTGHGLGLEVHTHPRLSSLNKEPLLENYVVTIEPGIYLPKWGGVRIEDDCWIQIDKCLPLNRSPKELIEL
jgi:Xaa-Pro aminopeptidase